MHHKDTQPLSTVTGTCTCIEMNFTHTICTRNAHTHTHTHACTHSAHTRTHMINLFPLFIQSQGLEFQVWSRSSLTHSGEEQSQQLQDDYIGSVHVDLCPLTCGLSHICGWYNISDFGGQTRGQLKVQSSVTLMKLLNVH